MPNYCFNTVVVTGDVEILKEFACQHFVFEDGDRKDQALTLSDLVDRERLEAKLECNTVIPIPVELVACPSYEHGVTEKNIFALLKYLKQGALDDQYSAEDRAQQLTSYHTQRQELIPLLRKQRSNFRRYGYGGWHSFQCAKWGTKWGAFDGSLVLDCQKSELGFNYTTAWGPIYGVIEKLIESYPQLSFECYYGEGDCGFQGELFGSNGVVTTDECWEDEESQNFLVD